ncbi:hypothetical protein OE09_0025 [Flavobacteriaceae bacterium MAR_2010_72]|nr:hypothetical protein OE09_0025 [Flavobacteriaceae bacterium MAR_2010_72]TVZ58270.1 hypothetical protein NA63_0766 [Flavobacteriaceae bacterium MAR_2010_105]
MIKKIFIVAFLTGFSQIISLVSVGFLKTLDQSLVYDIGNYESLIVVFTAIISLGLQLVTVRDIAVSEKWKAILLNSQRDRFTFSFVVLIGILLVDVFFKRLELETLLFYVVIPLIALNGDYSFYGKGEPERGAFLSFLRVGILSIFIIFSVVFDNPYVKITYVVTTLVTYFVVGSLSSHFNKQSYFVKPKLDFYKSYINSLDVGLASFALVFFGLGIISFASYFYTEEAVANAYLLLKIYVFYVGIKRLLVQILFKELKDEALVIIVDKIGMVIAISVIIALVYYPEYSIKFFAKNYQKSIENLPFLLPAIFFTSISFAGPLELLLKNKDKTYSLGFILGASIVLALVFIFSFVDNTNEAFIYLAISVGECSAIAIHGWGLNKFKFFKTRGLYAIGVVGLLFGINYIFLLFGSKILSLVLFVLSVSIYILFVFRKKIKVTID